MGDTPRLIKSFSGEYAFLSNFYPIDIELLGYPTVEHFFHAMKVDTGQSGCVNYRRAVREATTPGQAKRLGQAKGMERFGVHLRGDWNDIRLEVMAHALQHKFHLFMGIGIKLLATGDAHLIEGNMWHDNFWGSCQCMNCRDEGENHLGKLLMARRDVLKGLENGHRSS